MNIHFRCLESRIDKNNTLYGKFSLNSILSGQANTFANSLRRSLFSDLSGLAITHFCITSKPGLNYEFATLPGLTESLLDFSLNLKKVVLTGRVIDRAYTHFETLTTNASTGSRISDSTQSVPRSRRRRISDSTTAQSATCGPQGTTRPTAGHNSVINVQGGDSDGVGIGEKTLVSTSILEDRSNKLFNSRKKLVTALPIAPIGFLKAKGPAVLRASDLILPPGICCVHPNQYLGTLAADGALSIKILIAVGKGFIVQDEILYNSLSRAKLSFSSNATRSVSYSNLQNSFPLNEGIFFGDNVGKNQRFNHPSKRTPCNKSKIQNNGKGKAAISGGTSTLRVSGSRISDSTRSVPRSHRKTAPSSDNDSKDQKAHKIQKEELNGKKISSVHDREIFTSTTYLPPLSVRRFKKSLVRRSVDGLISTTANEVAFNCTRPQATSLARHPKVMNQDLNQRRFIEASRRRYSYPTTPLSRRFIKIQKSRYYLASTLRVSEGRISLLPKPFYCQGRKDLIWSAKQPDCRSNTQNIIKSSSKTNNFYEKIPINLRFNGFSQLLPLATKALSHSFTKNLSAMSLSDLIFVVQRSSKIKSKTFIPNSYPIDKLTNSSKNKSYTYSLPIIQSASTFRPLRGDESRIQLPETRNVEATWAGGTRRPEVVVPKKQPTIATWRRYSYPTTTARSARSAPIVQSYSETKQKEDLKDAIHKRLISQNKKVKFAFFGAKYNRYSNFNNGLEKEKLLTIAYKAQSNKFSPFLFVAISHKKAKNKSLRVFNTSVDPKIVHNTLEIPSPALRQGLSTEQATRIPVLKQGCSTAQKTQNNKNIFAGIKKQKVSRTQKQNSKKVQKVDNGPKQAGLLRTPTSTWMASRISDSSPRMTEGSPRSVVDATTWGRIEDSTTRRASRRDAQRRPGVVGCLPYVPAQNMLPYGSFTAIVNTSKKLSKKQLIWGAEQNFYPVLPLDVTFSPVSKVNFQINVDRNSEKNEEAIIFEIWTNGSITPKRAMQESCLALAQDFYNLFCHVNEFSRLRFWWKRDSLEFKATTMGSITNNRFMLSEGDSLLLSEHNAISPLATSEGRLVLSDTSATWAEGTRRASRSKILSEGSPPSKKEAIRGGLISKKLSFLMGDLRSKRAQPICSRESTVYTKQIEEQNRGNIENFKNRDSELYDPFIQKGLTGDKYTGEAAKSSDLIQMYKTNKTMHSQIKTCTKLNFSQSKNFKLKQKVYYLHAFWRLNISDLNLSLKTQLVLKKLNINSVYDLHSFILKKSWSLFLNHQQQKEIIKIYVNFGLNSPF